MKTILREKIRAGSNVIQSLAQTTLYPSRVLFWVVFWALATWKKALDATKQVTTWKYVLFERSYIFNERLAEAG